MKKLDLTNEILNDNSLYEMYKQKANDINKKAQEINNRIYRVIMNINNYLYS